MAKKFLFRALSVGLALTMTAGLMLPSFAAEPPAPNNSGALDSEEYESPPMPEDKTVEIISSGIADRLEQEAITDSNAAAKELSDGVKDKAITDGVETADKVGTEEDPGQLATDANKAVDDAKKDGEAATGDAAAAKTAADAASSETQPPEEAEVEAGKAADALEDGKQAVEERDREALKQAQEEAKEAAEKADEILKGVTEKYEDAEKAVKKAEAALKAAQESKDLENLENREKDLKAAQEKLEAAQLELEELAKTKAAAAKRQQEYAQVYAAVAAVLDDINFTGAGGEPISTENADKLLTILNESKFGNKDSWGNTALELLSAGAGVYGSSGSEESAEAFDKYLNGDPETGAEAAQLMAMMLGLVGDENVKSILTNNKDDVLSYLQGAYDVGTNPNSENQELALKMMGEKGIPGNDAAHLQMIQIYAAIVNDVVTKQQAAAEADQALEKAIDDYDAAAQKVADAQKRVNALKEKVETGKGQFNTALENAEKVLNEAKESLTYAKVIKDRTQAARDEAVESYNEAMKLVIRDITSSSSSSDDGAPSGPVVEIGDTDVPLAEGPITRAQFIYYLWQRAGKPEAEPAGFEDVAEDHEFAPAINWAKSIGIIEGNGDNTFAPGDLVTVSAVRTILTRYAAYLGIDMPELTTLKGGDGEAVLNCDQVLAEFFGEAYVPAKEDGEEAAA